MVGPRVFPARAFFIRVPRQQGALAERGRISLSWKMKSPKKPRGKSINARFRVFPRVSRQAGLSGSFLEKLFTSQPMFDGHLWQKQATLCVINDQESVA